jgi:ketosteroid isomerase-like protein
VVSSEGNVELVRRVFAAYSDGGIEAALPFYAADIVWRMDPDYWPEESAYIGHAGVRDFVASLVDQFADSGWDVHEIRAVGDYVLVLADFRVRIKESDAWLNTPANLLASRFGDEVMGEVCMFGTKERALEAAGLEG